uniref:UPF0506 domain-containing protein n=1 Tax=Schistosoma mansoni TaxID=6183 RepID=A0A5K4FBJ7_SCHMA
MINHSCFLILLTLTLYWELDAFTGRCKSEGEKCSKTIFSPCCANSTCQLHGIFKGVCVKCLPEKHLCLSSSECCTNSCKWFRCVETD